MGGMTFARKFEKARADVKTEWKQSLPGRLIQDIKLAKKFKREGSDDYHKQLVQAMMARYAIGFPAGVMRVGIGAATGAVGGMTVGGTALDTRLSFDVGKWQVQGSPGGKAVVSTLLSLIPQDKMEKWATIAQLIEITTDLARIAVEWPIYKRTRVLADSAATVLTPFGSGLLEFVWKYGLSRNTLTTQQQVVFSLSNSWNNVVRVGFDLLLLTVARKAPSVWETITVRDSVWKADAKIDQIRALSDNPR